MKEHVLVTRCFSCCLKTAIFFTFHPHLGSVFGSELTVPIGNSCSGLPEIHELGPLPISQNPGWKLGIIKDESWMELGWQEMDWETMASDTRR